MTTTRRVHVRYVQRLAFGSSWTQPAACLPLAEARSYKARSDAEAGPDAASRREWRITWCDCRPSRARA